MQQDLTKHRQLGMKCVVCSARSYMICGEEMTTNSQGRMFRSLWLRKTCRSIDFDVKGLANGEA